MESAVVNALAGLGRVIEIEEVDYVGLYPTWELRLQLHRPVPVYDVLNAPNCLYVDKRLQACDKWSYLRWSGSIVMPERQERIFPVWFLRRPKAGWIGRGKYRKKAVEIIELLVTSLNADWERFNECGRRGFATIKKARRSSYSNRGA